MLRFGRLTIWALALMLCAGAPLALAQTPSMPPDVQAILKKAQSGQQLTEAETKRMKEWAQSMQRQYGAGGAGGGTPAQSQSGSKAAPAAGGAGQPSSAHPSPNRPAASPAPGSTVGAQKTPCPPARAVAVPKAAPNLNEYIALIKSLVDTYGRRIGAGRGEIDRFLAQPGNAQAGGGMGAALFMTGAASAAVYSSAVQVERHPEDLQAADNLAVALDTIPDPVPATQVFLYIRKMTPDAALPALNLGWSYFNSGNSTLAQQQFQEASRLGTDLAGPDAGLGMLATCRGDRAAALAEFRKSLRKGYSSMVYMGYRNAQQGQNDDSPIYDVPDENTSSGDAAAGPAPELPVSDDPAATFASAPAFQHAADFADQRSQAALRDFQDALNRVMALGRKARQNPDGSLDLPRIFDKQLLQYNDMVRLTLGQTGKLYAQQGVNAARVVASTVHQAEKEVQLYLSRITELQQQKWQTIEARAAACPDLKDRCTAPFDTRIDTLTSQIDDFTYRECNLEKGNLDTEYSQEYKVWKQFADSLRDSSRDLYAYSQPVIEEVWAPALYDLLQAQRELAVLILYGTEARDGMALVDVANQISQKKCVPPKPPPLRKTAKDPDLKKEKSNCPLVPPLNIGFGVLDMKLGCDKVEISGGEVLRFKFERNFVKKETAYYVGVGAAASLPKVDLGGGTGLSALPKDAGENWAPPGSTAGAGVVAEVMVGIRVNDAGAVQDISLESTVMASGNAAFAKGSIGLTGTVSLENGANVDAIISGSLTPPKVDLPGGMSWTPTGK